MVDFLTRQIDRIAVNLNRAPRVRSRRRLQMMDELRKLRIARMKIELRDCEHGNEMSGSARQSDVLPGDLHPAYTFQ